MRGMRLFGTIFILTMMLFPASIGYGQDEMLIGLIPEENIFRQMDRHRPLAAYLSEKLGIKVKLTILSRYGDVIDRFVARKMDGAFFGVFTSVLAMEKLGVEPVARPVNTEGGYTVESYIFVRKDSGIRTAKDMRGKKIAFVDRATATGYLFAAAFLRENGVREIDGYFKEYFFTGSHDAAIYAVLDNRADIGTAKSTVFKKAVEKDPSIRDELVIIATSEALPDTTLCLRKDLPASLKNGIRKALLEMDRDPSGREVLKKLGASRFVEAGRDDFRQFFTLAEKAGIALKTYRYK